MAVSVVGPALAALLFRNPAHRPVSTIWSAMERTPVLVFIYLLSLLLIGVGYIAIMPPFEGFDETAHFASLRQIADTGAIPLYGRSFLPQDIADYRGPAAYSTIAPPFDSRLVYAKFFAQPDMVARFVQDYRRPQPHPPFVPSQQVNWEAQHPPLYYLLLAPVLRLVEPAAFVSQILVLRLISYLFAVAGVFFAMMAIPSSDSSIEPRAAFAGFLLYPIMLPMFFPEFARLGNDSLCLLFAGAAAFSLAKGLADERSLVWPMALGTSLGLGLLTKAFFLPITFAIGVFLLLRLWRTRGDGASWRLEWRNACTSLALPVLIGGGWYLRDYLAYGDFSGNGDAIHIAATGGIWATLKQHHSLFAFVRGVAVMIVTWVWAGTWSLVRIPPLLYAPLFLLLIVTIGGYLKQLKGTPLTRPEWLPVLLFASLSIGLFYHVVEMVAIGGGGTGGWYLHILMPWVAPALGLGAYTVLKRTWQRQLFTVLVVFALLFQAMAIWAQIALFTGCAVKGDDKSYVFSGHSFCVDQYATVFDRLSIIGWPWLAGAGFGGGLLCIVWFVLQLNRQRRSYGPQLESPALAFYRAGSDGSQR
jgi:Dolichyl-phosphate-mannose-protein mannosyltransferase